MESNNNRAGWVQMKYNCVACELPSVELPRPIPVPPGELPLPTPAPIPTPEPLPTPMPMPTPPIIETPDGECENMALAVAYVKKQRWGEVYEAEAGLSRGTVFPELDLPFVGEGACPYNE